MKTEFDSLYILTTTPGLITQVDIRPQHMDTRTEFMTVKGFKNRDKKKKRDTWTRYRENHMQASRSHLFPKASEDRSLKCYMPGKPIGDPVCQFLLCLVMWMSSISCTLTFQTLRK